MRTQDELLDDILEAIDAIRQHRDSDQLPTRVREVWLIFHLMLIGEAAGKLDPAVREAMPNLPWRQIIRTRNHLIHGYYAIRLDIVEDSAHRGVEGLATAIKTYRSEKKDP